MSRRSPVVALGLILSGLITGAASSPDTAVVTGPNFQQVPSSQMLVTPSGGAQMPLGSALGGAGLTSQLSQNQAAARSALGINPTGLRVQAFGDSEDNFNANNALNNTGLTAGDQYIAYSESGVLAQAIRFLGGPVIFDLTQGYGPVFYLNGPMKVVISNGGNYAIAPTGASIVGCTGATLGTPVMNGSVVASVPITAVTSANCATGAVVSLTGGQGTAATAFIIDGAGGTLGAPGATTTQMLSYVGDAVAAKVDIIAMHGGTNDFGASIPIATTEANLQTLWEALMASGKTVIYYSLLPLNQSGGTTHQLQVTQINQWARRWIAGQGNRPPGTGNIIFIDREPECTDQTSATGAFLAICSADGLHEGNWGPWILGYKLAQALKGTLSAYGQYVSTSQADTYDATNNPGGALAAPAFYTWSGGSALSPCTGTVPAGWEIQRYSGSGTGTPCVGSIENPRTDLFSGSRFVVTTTTGSGTSFEQFSLNNGGATIASLPITPGVDAVYGEAWLAISGVANMIELQVQVNCQSAGPDLAEAVDQAYPANSGTLNGPSDSIPFIMRTPPMVCPAGTTGVFLQLQWVMNGSGGAGSATSVIKVSNFTLRKQQSP